jgi:hypothetical protein
MLSHSTTLVSHPKGFLLLLLMLLMILLLLVILLLLLLLLVMMLLTSILRPVHGIGSATENWGGPISQLSYIWLLASSFLWSTPMALGTTYGSERWNLENRAGTTRVLRCDG